MLLLRFCRREKAAQRLGSWKAPFHETWLMESMSKMGNLWNSFTPMWTEMLGLTISGRLTFLLTSLLFCHIPECISNFIKHIDTQQLYVIKIACLGK